MRPMLCGAAALVLCAGGVAQGAFIDTEPNNNTPAGADYLGVFGDGDARVIVASLFPNDVDWFRIDVDTDIPGFLTTITFPLTNPNNNPDTILAVFDVGLNLLGINDDGMSGGGGQDSFGSAVRLPALSAGTYYIAVSGNPDFDLLGNHTQSGFYALTVSFVIPSPGAGALAACAGLVTLRRRRQ